jgi:hypothetical protein
MQKQLRYQLIQATRLLAAEAEVQIQSLPSFVHIPDELALTFGDCFLTVKSKPKDVGLDDATTEKMYQIDELLAEMSSRTDLWTLDSLRNSPEWQRVRQEAQSCLLMLNEAQAPIDLGWLTFIGKEQ